MPSVSIDVSAQPAPFLLFCRPNTYHSKVLHGLQTMPDCPFRITSLTAHAASTKNFSGAELEGLVKAAVSFALNRQVDVSDLSKPIDEDNIKVRDITPAAGAAN